jgi:hypothetical protein
MMPLYQLAAHRARRCPVSIHDFENGGVSNSEADIGKSKKTSFWRGKTPIPKPCIVAGELVTMKVF